jgi:predicted ester cyclase
MEPVEGQNKAVVLRMIDIVNTQQPEKLVDVFEADFVDHGPSAGAGVAGLQKGLAMMHAALPDQHFAVEEVVAEGDMVSIRGTITATFSGGGALFGVPASGQYAKWASLMSFRINDGKIAERWVNADTWGMLQQIGVLPSPAWDMSSLFKDAQHDAKSEEVNRKEARRFVEEVWGNRNLEAVDSFFAPDGGIAGDVPAGGAVLLKPDAIKMIGGAVFQAFPDFKAEIEFVMAERDKVVVRVAEKGTHEGDYMGVPASGKEVAWSDTFHLDMKDGKIVRAWLQSDVMGLMSKIGGFKPQVPAQAEDRAESKPDPTSESQLVDSPAATPLAQKNKAVFKRFVEELWNQKQFALADEIIAPEHFSSSLPFLPEGPEGMKLIAGIVAGPEEGIFPDLERELLVISATDDVVSAVWVNRGTHKGTYMNVPGTGKKVEWTELCVAKFKDGKMVETWFRPDEVGLLKQIAADKLEWLHF